MHQSLTFESLFNQLSTDTIHVSLPAFAPELTLCATAVLLLLLRIPPWLRWINSAYVALAGSVLALYLVAPWKHLNPALPAAELVGSSFFTGMLVYDELTIYFRAALILFLILFIIFTRISGIPDREDSADFYTLVVGGTIGMCLMASANHMLMVFMGVEMASVPSYALAGMLKGRRQSSEAALKYSIYGAGAAGIMLYGISLLGGVLGTLHLPTMAIEMAEMLDSGIDPGRQSVLVLGGLMITVGLAFKLSAVPFHFWCPDVFEGASAEVDAFLSVASKAAALALLIRVSLGLGFVSEQTPPAVPVASAAAAERFDGEQRLQDERSQDDGSPARGITSLAAHVVAKPISARSAGESTKPAVSLLAAADPPAVEEAPHTPEFQVGLTNALAPARRYMVGLIALLSAITCTFGNLTAYGQNNLKRLLAYSTIAHAGYLMMPVAAGLALIETNTRQAENAFAALAFYVAAYLFMNLGAFAVVAFMRNRIRSEDVRDYAGLVQSSPGLVICFSIILMSLIGIPPFAGFAAKFNIFAALVDAKLWTLLVIGGVNTVISLFYYLRVIKVMTLDPPAEGSVVHGFSLLSVEGIYVTLITVPVVALGIWWNTLNEWARHAASQLLS